MNFIHNLATLIVMQREAPREIKNLSRTTSFRTLNGLAWPDPWMHGP